MRPYLHILQKPLLCLGLFAFSAGIAAPRQALADDAQAASPAKQSFYDSIPNYIRKTDASFFTLTVENDLFGNGQDRNYTNGVRLTYFDYSKAPPEFSKTIADFIPQFEVNDTTSVYYSFGQNLYTPNDITAAVPDPQDRPYAAFLYGSAGLTTLSENHIDDLEMTLGIVGPWALGEEVQDAVHHTINADNPSGWDSQLHNEPGVILSWQRRWPGYFSRDAGPFTTRLIPHAGLTAGNIYTYANAGATFQITPARFKWQSLPPRVRPAIPGSGYFAVPTDTFAWSLFAGGETRLIGRNIFLDGNSFRDSPSVDKRYTVADFNAGLSMNYGKTQISYTLNWRSREFRGQDDQSLFGAISLGYRF
ncbi:MAG: hypothetical protein CL570_00605 [Alphaproteobacteria bacterium]|nr:hypothetical protein [Alphaproteobacteria bacterium]HCQ71495.1 DUF2219 domain-containing protein [Rhodospirillaceae bacterium]|tara:strand:- start:1957 stop:3045 length:1089 start_codon:yes stop_codon:yes gene_type:complete